MTINQQIETAWEGLRDAIDAAHKDEQKTANGSALSVPLSGYAREIEVIDKLKGLLQDETTAERLHRRGAPNGWKSPMSAYSAAQLMLCRNAFSGSKLPAIPSAIEFLVCRETAIKAEVIGWLIREHVTPEWAALVSSLDYSEIMKAGY